ncbi:hypothetical protein [Flavobacterium hydatis]|jgi:hypothetical protein|nr:hypothetical protein [Flavobacterium hydatis]
MKNENNLTNIDTYAKIVLSAVILWAFVYFAGYVVGQTYHNITP